MKHHTKEKLKQRLKFIEEDMLKCVKDGKSIPMKLTMKYSMLVIEQYKNELVIRSSK